MEKIVVEIDGRYYKFDLSRLANAGRLTIGRAFYNDIIVADDYIGPSQVALVASADDNYCWTLTVTDQTNPVFIDGAKVNGHECDLQSGAELTMGRTTIRFYEEDHQVSDTSRFTLANWLHIHRLKALFAGLMLLGLFSITLIASILESSTELEWGMHVGIAISPVLFAIVWASGWSLVGRFLNADYYYFSHIFLTAFCFSLSILFGDFYSYFDYMFSSALLGEIVDILVTMLIFGLLISLGLTLVSNDSRPFGKGLAASVCIVGLIATLMYLYEDDYTNKPTHTVTVKPSYVPTPAPTSVNGFISDYDDLFDQLSSNS